MPAQQIVVQGVHDLVNGQAEQADSDHAGDDLVGPHEFPRFENPVAKAVIDGDHLGNDNDDKGGADADTDTCQNIGGCSRQDHPAEHGAPTGPQVAGGAQIDAVNILNTGDGVHQNREESTEGDQKNSRRVAEPKPEDRHGYPGDGRYWPQYLNYGVEIFVDAGRGTHEEAQRQRQSGSQQETSGYAAETAEYVQQQFTGAEPLHPFNDYGAG